MSELRLVGNHISDTWWNIPIIGAGHFQVVYDTGKLRPDGKHLQYEIEVLSSNNGEWNVLDGHWEYWPKLEGTPDGPPRDHINYTPEHPERDGIPDNDTNNVYDYAIIHEGATADSAWTILEKVNDQFNVALDNGHQIPYNRDYNSNSYATTLLYVIGVDINNYAEGAKPPDVSRFPGQGENALLDPEDAISLNLKGTAENDIIHTGVKDDKLDGGDGNDKLYGGLGEDILSGGWGFDLLDGGEGVDTVDYSYHTLPEGLSVDLASGEVHGPQQPDNLLRNGSLEEGTDPGVYLPINPGFQDITGWEVIRGQIDYVGTDWVSSDENRSLDLNGTPGVGGVAQTFTTIPGQQYQVSFDLAGHYSGLLQQMVVSAAGQSAEFSFQSGTDPKNLGWKEFTWDFTANSPQTTLEFYSLQTVYEYGGPALDDVVVTGLGVERLVNVEFVNGSGGNDTLIGNASNNELRGNAGNDVLRGGTGSDFEDGGPGNDIYDYDSVDDSPYDPSWFQSDGIEFGFPGAVAGDLIDFSTIDADVSTSDNQAFTFLGTTAPVDGQGTAKVWVLDAAPAVQTDFSLVYASTDSDNAPELLIRAGDSTVSAANWALDDFIL